MKFVEQFTRLSGTPAEAGVRGSARCHVPRGVRRLSGTPAEAGVRGQYLQNTQAM